MHEGKHGILDDVDEMDDLFGVDEEKDSTKEKKHDHHDDHHDDHHNDQKKDK